MKIKYIPKAALLILFASLIFGCVKKPEDKKKEMEFNSYTEHVVENHHLIREKMKPFADSIDLYAKYRDFTKYMEPLLMEVDEIIRKNDSLEAKSHKDSLVFAMSSRLISNYWGMLSRDFLEIYFIVDQNKANEERHKIDSIITRYMENDRVAVKYFNQYLDSTHIPLKPFQP